MKTATMQFDRSSIFANIRALGRNLGLGLSLLVPAMGVAHADGPGRGATAQFEKNYLVFIINHHYSALRMTELAAGTDLTRDAQVVAPQEGMSPTPGFNATPPKASDDEIKSMARMGNLSWVDGDAGKQGQRDAAVETLIDIMRRRARRVQLYGNRT